MNYEFNNLFNALSSTTSTLLKDVYHNDGMYLIKNNTDDKIELLVSVVGHNPDDVDVTATENEIHIRTNTDEINSIVRNIDLKFTVGKQYDGTTAQASIKNGLLTIILNKSSEARGKQVKIKF